MKKLFVLCLTLVVCFTMTTVAFAEDGNGGLYVSGKAGIGFIRGDKSLSNNQTASPASDETKWTTGTLSYGASIGWNWLDSGLPVRTEIEYYDHGDTKMTHKDANATFDVTTEVQTVQMNLFYDFYTDTNFIPYLGGGIGVAQVKSGGKSVSNVAYSLFGGAAYKMTDNLLLDLQYRINNFGEVKLDWRDTNNEYTGKIKNLYAIEAALGLRYQF